MGDMNFRKHDPQQGPLALARYGMYIVPMTSFGSVFFFFALFFMGSIEFILPRTCHWWLSLPTNEEEQKDGRFFFFHDNQMANVDSVALTKLIMDPVLYVGTHETQIF